MKAIEDLKRTLSSHLEKKIIGIGSRECFLGTRSSVLDPMKKIDKKIGVYVDTKKKGDDASPRTSPLD